MSPVRSTSVEQYLEAMNAWPIDWAVDDSDVHIGRYIIEQLTGFISHVHASGLAASTIRRHVDNLHLLGGTLIHDRHYHDPPAPVPDLIDVVEEGGGPLIDRGEYTPAQQSFDATCRKLYKFLLNPEPKPRKRPPPHRRRRLSHAVLDSMISEATTDAYGPEEEVGGLLVYLQEQVDVPFNTTVLGVQVQVVGFDMGTPCCLAA